MWSRQLYHRGSTSTAAIINLEDTQGLLERGNLSSQISFYSLKWRHIPLHDTLYFMTLSSLEAQERSISLLTLLLLAFAYFLNHKYNHKLGLAALIAQAWVLHATLWRAGTAFAHGPALCGSLWAANLPTSCVEGGRYAAELEPDHGLLS